METIITVLISIPYISMNLFFRPNTENILMLYIKENFLNLLEPLVEEFALLQDMHHMLQSMHSINVLIIIYSFIYVWHNILNEKIISYNIKHLLSRYYSKKSNA